MDAGKRIIARVTKKGKIKQEKGEEKWTQDIVIDIFLVD